MTQQLYPEIKHESKSNLPRLIVELDICCNLQPPISSIRSDNFPLWEWWWEEERASGPSRQQQQQVPGRWWRSGPVSGGGITKTIRGQQQSVIAGDIPLIKQQRGRSPGHQHTCEPCLMFGCRNNCHQETTCGWTSHKPPNFTICCMLRKDPYKRKRSVASLCKIERQKRHMIIVKHGSQFCRQPVTNPLLLQLASSASSLLSLVPKDPAAFIFSL